MITQPREYLEWMQRLLGDEYNAFSAIYHHPPTSGLRVNTLKIEPREFIKKAPFQLAHLPWTASGFTLALSKAETNETSVAKHPYYAAGLYYLQDPSAMLAVEALDPQPGEIILDIAAAPGGKSTHIASQMKNQGLLIANEIHPRRVWELAENLERWGARNIIITNETAQRLVGQLPGYFDKVLLDAPCSGEGMFRKSAAARQDWSPEFVRGCALRQSGLLEDAARLVRSGGRIVYATCTFNPVENEQVIHTFLKKHPDFQLVSYHPIPGVTSGRPDWLQGEKDALSDSLKHALRLWPHLTTGEGHFVAVLGHSGVPGNAPKDKSFPWSCPASSKQLYREFVSNTLSEMPADGFLHQQGTYLYLLSPRLPDLSHIKVIHPGLWLGVLKTQRFEPAHALALALSTSLSKRQIDLSMSDAQRYLRGESLPLEGPPGWALVTYDNFPLGWGKFSRSVLKNYYPRGLRHLS